MCTTPNQTQPAGARRADGFTLVELLMVIALISILVGLVTFAARRALNRGGEARTQTEIGLLSNAVEQYKIEYGSYPPNPGTLHNYSTTTSMNGLERETERQRRIERHISRAFNRFSGGYSGFKTTIANATSSSLVNSSGVTVPDVLANGLNVDNIDGAEALVFWIGGVPQIFMNEDESYSYELTGFSSNPANPFESIVDMPQRTQRLFEFDQRRLVDRDKDGWPEYVFDGRTPFDTPPYVYFDAPTYTMAYYPYAPLKDEDDNPVNTTDRSNNEATWNTTWGTCRPYAREVSDPGPPATYRWFEDQGFQIIASGSDGQYGASGFNYPIREIVSGTNFTEYDQDNLTNFSDERLGSAFESGGTNP